MRRNAALLVIIINYNIINIDVYYWIRGGFAFIASSIIRHYNIIL